MLFLNKCYTKYDKTVCSSLKADVFFQWINISLWKNIFQKYAYVDTYANVWKGSKIKFIMEPSFLGALELRDAFNNNKILKEAF